MQHRRSTPISRRRLIGLAAALPMTLALGLPVMAATPDATSLLRAAFDNWRSGSSQTEVTMTIHRPTWQRTMSMNSYTRGNDDALVRFTAPAKEAGNATLKVGKNTWVYNPKLNQVVKLPASLLAQPWMGSDFSYSDLARSEDILKFYDHKIIGQSKSGGRVLYSVQATPKPGAPVVWGKQVAVIRDDGILMEMTYYDQDMKPVRKMTTDKVRNLGGRNYPAVITMRAAGSSAKWTRLETKTARFDLTLPAYLFTKSNLSNPRD
jgi:outer membrane lipoprotein-sorting protein